MEVQVFVFWHHAGHGVLGDAPRVAARSRDGQAPPAFPAKKGFGAPLHGSGDHGEGVSDDRLGAPIADNPNLGMVVLNVCFAGSPAGLGPRLASLKVANVLAFCRPVVDLQAVKFAGELYRNLARRSLETTVVRCRQSFRPSCPTWFSIRVPRPACTSSQEMPRPCRTPPKIAEAAAAGRPKFPPPRSPAGSFSRLPRVSKSAIGRLETPVAPENPNHGYPGMRLRTVEVPSSAAPSAAETAGARRPASHPDPVALPTDPQAESAQVGAAPTPRTGEKKNATAAESAAPPLFAGGKRRRAEI